MWIARNKDGTLGIFTNKPVFNDGIWYCEETDNPVFIDEDANFVWDCQQLNSNAYPGVTFENSSKELIVKKMTREEQIFNAATESYGLDVRSVNSCTKVFSDGAKWADSHPNWHKYPDEKPHYKGDYITCDESGEIEINQWQQASNSPNSKWYGKVSLYPQNPIIAWMENPQPPKFD